MQGHNAAHKWQTLRLCHVEYAALAPISNTPLTAKPKHKQYHGAGKGPACTQSPCAGSVAEYAVAHLTYCVFGNRAQIAEVTTFCQQLQALCSIALPDVVSYELLTGSVDVCCVKCRDACVHKGLEVVDSCTARGTIITFTALVSSRKLPVAFDDLSAK
jgi:hypothetical protein